MLIRERFHNVALEVAYRTGFRPRWRDRRTPVDPHYQQEQVLRLGEFYNAPTDAIQRGLDIPAYLVSAEDYNSALIRHFRARGVNKREAVERAKWDVESTAGALLYDTHSEYVIYGKLLEKAEDNEVTVRHELLHAMARKSQFTGGFCIGPALGGLEEATITLLEFAERNRETPLLPQKYHPNEKNLLGMLKSRELKIGYMSPLMLLLRVIQTTQESPDPITAQRLGGFFFGETEKNLKELTTFAKTNSPQRAVPFIDKAFDFLAEGNAFL